MKTQTHPHMCEFLRSRYPDHGARQLSLLLSQKMILSATRTSHSFTFRLVYRLNVTVHSYIEGNILKMDLRKYGEFEAILMNPPWYTGDQKDPSRLPGTIVPEELV